MNGIDLLIQEHTYVMRMLAIMRKASYKFMETNEIDYDDFDKMISFVRTFADGHHHKKEEIYLFNKMVEHLGELGKKVITNGMLVEHDLGRAHIGRLNDALIAYKNGDKEAKLDIIGNIVGYCTLLKSHIEKEDNVIFGFARRSLDAEILNIVDEECTKYEVENAETLKENMNVLTYLEEKYL